MYVGINMLFIDVLGCTISPENITYKETTEFGYEKFSRKSQAPTPQNGLVQYPRRLDNHPWWPKACHHDVVPSSTFASTPGDEKPNDLMEDMWIFLKWKKIHHVYPRTQLILGFDWKGPCIVWLTFKNKGRLGSRLSETQTLFLLGVPNLKNTPDIYLQRSRHLAIDRLFFYRHMSHMFQNRTAFIYGV